MIVLLALTAHAGTVELSPGDDVASKTRYLGPGDTVTFAGGVYELDETLVWEAPGTEDEPITIQGRDDDVEVVLRRSGSGVVAILRDSAHVTVRNLSFEGAEGWEDAGQVGFRIQDSSHVAFEGNRIRQVEHTALDVDGDNSDVRIVGNRIHDTTDGSGILVGCGDASCWLERGVIAGNLVHDLGGQWITGIRLDHGTQDVEVRDNVLFRIGTGDGADAIFAGSTEGGEPNTIEGNALWDVVDDGIWIEGSAIVRNNIVHLTGGVGIGARGGDRDGLLNTVISHNTVVLTGDWAVSLEDWYYRGGMVFANNLVANPTGRGVRYLDDWGDGDPTSNHLVANHVTGLVEGLDAEVFPSAVVPGAGLSDFVDPDGLDFYPVQHSAVLNSGDTSGQSWVPERDFNGTPRQGDAPDVGAYEWNGPGNPGWPLQEDFKGVEVEERDSVEVSKGCCKKKEEPSEALVVVPFGLLWALRRRRRD